MKVIHRVLCLFSVIILFYLGRLACKFESTALTIFGVASKEAEKHVHSSRKFRIPWENSKTNGTGE